MDVWDIIKTHPLLKNKDIEIQKKKLRNWIRDEAEAIVTAKVKSVEKELTAEVLMTLHDMGAEEADLKTFAKHFNTMMDRYRDFLGEDCTVGEGCYFDLTEIYPDCDEWIQLREHESEE